MLEQDRRRLARAGRERMRSPGRPPVSRREDRQRFWAAIRRGLTSEDAAAKAGVSPVVGTRWFREAGGMPPITRAPLSGWFLSFAEREELAILHARECGVREIARRTARSPSTISRELRRNAATRGGSLEYRATAAQWHADRRAMRPKIAKFAANDALRAYVQDRLAGTITWPDGAAVPGLGVRWAGRRQAQPRGCGRYRAPSPNCTRRRRPCAARRSALPACRAGPAARRPPRTAPSAAPGRAADAGHAAPSPTGTARPSPLAPRSAWPRTGHSPVGGTSPAPAGITPRPVTADHAAGAAPSGSAPGRHRPWTKTRKPQARTRTG